MRYVVARYLIICAGIGQGCVGIGLVSTSRIVGVTERAIRPIGHVIVAELIGVSGAQVGRGHALMSVVWRI